MIPPGWENFAKENTFTAKKGDTFSVLENIYINTQIHTHTGGEDEGNTWRATVLFRSWVQDLALLLLPAYLCYLNYIQ